MSANTLVFESGVGCTDKTIVTAMSGTVGILTPLVCFRKILAVSAQSEKVFVRIPPNAPVIAAEVTASYNELHPAVTVSCYK